MADRNADCASSTPNPIPNIGRLSSKGKAREAGYADGVVLTSAAIDFEFAVHTIDRWLCA